MTDSAVTWFSSKVDWWLRIVLFVLPLLSLYLLVQSIFSADRAAVVPAVIGCVIVASIYGLLVIPVRYGIGREHLVIRFGVVRQRVQLSAIQEVLPTHNPLSSPALSLDRLAVRTGTGLRSTTMISPRDRDVFLDLLANAAGLRREGDRLIRERKGAA